MWSGVGDINRDRRRVCRQHPNINHKGEAVPAEGQSDTAGQQGRGWEGGRNYQKELLQPQRLVDPSRAQAGNRLPSERASSEAGTESEASGSQLCRQKKQRPGK